MIKYLILVLGVGLAVVLQTAFFSVWQLYFLNLPLMLGLGFFWPDKSSLVWWAVLCGLLLDAISGLSFGVWTLSLLVSLWVASVFSSQPQMGESKKRRAPGRKTDQATGNLDNTDRGVYQAARLGRTALMALVMFYLISGGLNLIGRQTNFTVFLNDFNLLDFAFAIIIDLVLVWLVWRSRVDISLFSKTR